jgi:perosamine synthetase
MKIPFYRPCIGTEEAQEVLATLQGGWLTTGPRTKQFEKDFSAYMDQKHAVAVNSCTAALHLALEAVGVRARQMVVVPTMTFAATAEVVRYMGAHPLLVDCRAEDFNLDVEDAEKRILSALEQEYKVRTIIPVHYGGQVGDISGLQELARRFKLRIVEDAAHSCPAYYKSHAEALAGNGETIWHKVGNGSDVSCYSFYANKTITTGEGGMACTQNDEFADRMRIMSLHGISRDAWKRFTAEGSWNYEIVAPGFKYNMTDIAAALGIHQLRKADQMHRQRRRLAELYSRGLGDVDELILPSQKPGRIHSWHLYVVRLRLDRLKIDRAQFIVELHRRGIGTSVHWMPLHLHPYYRQSYGYAAEDFPMASALYEEIVTLPLYPDMTEEDVYYVCDSIRNVLANNLRHSYQPVTSVS